MFSFLAKKRPTTARINGVTITVDPKETLLQAALRQGIAFPHSCRVGGCAKCKCKLVEGKVKELTKTAYILSDEDLDQGYILACQSVPQSDIMIDVDLSGQQASHQVTGRVIGQSKLTSDITQLRVQLDAPLSYKAGQFANISVGSLKDVFRSYSFATPMQPDGQVSFYVRKVLGGVFSTLINDGDVLGQSVVVDGPLGDFWLRPSDAPLMLIAGGSGLAPVVAMLQEALKDKVERPVALLFGAREEKDLYALDVIDGIARHWRGQFKFVPVLSGAAADAPWKGERGMVADQIEAFLVPGSHAYLCGPPPMIDACAVVLQARGVAREDIHADRFTTLHDEPTVAA